MKFCIAVLATALSVTNTNSQVLVPSLNTGGTARLLPEDFAVFESPEPRNDLPCSVTPIKPEVGFDFAFHSGYEVILPMKELVGSGNRLTILFRVIPQDGKGVPIYMAQKVRVPSLDESVRGTSTLLGHFALGEGRYHVDWLMRDKDSRVCAKSWNLQAKLSSRDANLKPWLRQVLAQPEGKTPFWADPPVERDPQSGLLNIDVIVNFSPQNPNSTVLVADDLDGLIGALRRIAQDPRIGEHSVLVCSIQAEKVLQVQENVSQVDFPAIGAALKSLNLGLIDAAHLTRGPAQFVASLIGERLMKSNRDALVIVGPKNSWQQKMPRELLTSLEDSNRPIFYLNYNLDPSGNPWRDLVGSIVRSKAGIEYTITEPSDLFKAWSDIVSRLTKRKQASHADALSPDHYGETADTHSGATLPQP